jgi:hypothetical protein
MTLEVIVASLSSYDVELPIRLNGLLTGLAEWLNRHFVSFVFATACVKTGFNYLKLPK